MKVVVTCPHCSQTSQIDAYTCTNGTSVQQPQCPKCHKRFQVAITDNKVSDVKK